MSRYLSPDEAKRMSAARKNCSPGSGRPRSRTKRCFCGEMTVKRALARGHKCQIGTNA